MTSIRRFIAVSKVMVRIFVFAVAMMLVMQGGIAHFGAAHNHGSCDHSTPQAADHQHESASHASDHGTAHKHANNESGHDAAQCCGWMCTAAICTGEPSEPRPIIASGADDTFVAQMPLDWLLYGPDRPPRPRPLTI